MSGPECGHCSCYYGQPNRKCCYCARESPADPPTELELCREQLTKEAAATSALQARLINERRTAEENIGRIYMRSIEYMRQRDRLRDCLAKIRVIANETANAVAEYGPWQRVITLIDNATKEEP